MDSAPQSQIKVDSCLHLKHVVQHKSKYCPHSPHFFVHIHPSACAHSYRSDVHINRPCMKTANCEYLITMNTYQWNTFMLKDFKDFITLTKKIKVINFKRSQNLITFSFKCEEVRIFMELEWKRKTLEKSEGADRLHGHHRATGTNHLKDELSVCERQKEKVPLSSYYNSI